MLRLGCCALTLVAMVACTKSPSTPTQSERVRIVTLGGNQVEIVPTEGQLPYCHVFTRSDTGVLRQLTMTHDNLSLPCPANEPIGDVTFRIPEEEGPVTFMVLFSDQQVNGASIGLQLYDLPKDQPVTGLNLRAQGQIVTALVPFTPGEPNASATGGLVGESGTVTPAQQREMEEAIAADAGGIPIPGKDKFLSPAGDSQAVAADPDASGSEAPSEKGGDDAAAAPQE